MNLSADELLRFAEELGVCGLDGALYRIIVQPNVGVDFVDSTDRVRAELIRTSDNRGWLLYTHSEFDAVQPDEPTHADDATPNVSAPFIALPLDSKLAGVPPDVAPVILTALSAGGGV